MPAGKKQHKQKAEIQSKTHEGFLTHTEFKQKLLERPDVKKAYDALEPEYQRERAKIKKDIANQ